MERNPAKLRWHCRRGMLELDAILQPFFDRYYDNLSDAQQQTFAALLDHTDPELYNWFIGSETPADADLRDLVGFIKKAQII